MIDLNFNWIQSKRFWEDGIDLKLELNESKIIINFVSNLNSQKKNILQYDLKVWINDYLGMFYSFNFICNSQHIYHSSSF